MKTVHPIFIYCAAFAWLGFSGELPGVRNNNRVPVPSINSSSPDSTVGLLRVAGLYASLGLRQLGLSEQTFRLAVKGYHTLVDQHQLGNDQYLTICDMSQSSSRKRLYVIDMDRERIVMNTYVSHGRNSGGEYAREFSNRPESLQSSLGFYTTARTYQGTHGLSLRLRGMEQGFNDRALERNIVMHGADYASGGGGSLGRSFGCPAVPEKYSRKIINLIRNGSCLFIYHPTASYLRGSRLLNG